MAAVSVERMRELEGLVMGGGVGEGELMERAGVALGRAIGRQYGDVGFAVGYVGKGHNGGDALIALRVLRDEFGWRVGVRAAYGVEDWAGLTRRQWELLGLGEFLEKGFDWNGKGDFLLLDGLLGIGARGGLRGGLLEMAEEMAGLRNRCGAVVLAVDNPSGVDPDSGEIFEGAVVADRTFMIGAAKRGLLLGRAANAVGGLVLVEVEGLEDRGEGEMELICPQGMDFGKGPRDFDFHKGKAGRVGIVAGSVSFTGAGLMTALGAVRGGGGLVTLYVRSEVAEWVRGRLPLEVMLKVCDDPREVLEERVDVWVVGPGLGAMSDEYERGVLELLEKAEVPMVVDADGLNLMARRGFVPDGRHLLTPHVGEFARLVGGAKEEMEREEMARAYVERVGSVLLLKGARTIVAKRGRALRVNSTGTPGMSSGGQGDLLAGVLGALMAGGMENFDAAALGAWVCGHAAEMVAREGDVCPATDVAEMIPRALRGWRRGER